MTLLEIYC